VGERDLRAMLRVLVLLCAQIALIGHAQTPICAIQGSGTSSPYADQSLFTTGIVTAIYSGSGTVQGFFIEDPGCDSDPATSNGLFVYNPNTSGISLGQRVSVSGTVIEFQGLTELTNVTNIAVIGSGTVPPTEINLPITNLANWERYEGMLLRFPQSLAVTGNDSWAQYGELVLSPQRLFQPTDVLDPNDNPPSGTTSTGTGNVAAITALAELHGRSTILLDDGRTSTYPNPPPLIGPQGTVRCGSTVTALTGVLTYAFNSFRLHPVGMVPLQHEQRPSAPNVGGQLRIASLNVRNYFTTLGDNGASNANELMRQRTKLVAALQGLNADALVLCELENNDPASADLLAGLNAAAGGGYAQIDHDAPGSFTRSVIFYRVQALTPVTVTWALNTSTFERAQITQGFQANASGKRFLLSMVHLRSKLCNNASGTNLDQGDGQGCYNARRRQQAAELLTHWAGIRSSTWIPGQLIMGDFNAYDQEDPIDRLRAGGLIDLISGVPQPHTYIYENRSGSIDHALATEAMADAVTGAAVWNINSDEPPNLDYRDGNFAFYQPNAFRSSDHDPIVVGLDVNAIPVGLEELSMESSVRFNYDAGRRSAIWQGEMPMRLELLDALGRVVGKSGYSARHEVNLHDLPDGTYIWRAWPKGEKAPEVGRFVAW